MAHFQLEHGPIPLHHQVYLDMRRAIDGGEWAPGNRVPSERDLAGRYGCSLITIRHALGELAREARIERTRGRGTFVLPTRIEHDFAGQFSFSEDVRRRGLEPATRTVAMRTEPAGEAVGAALGVPAAALVHYVERLRLADGEAVLLEQARLPAGRFPGLLDADLERESLYERLANRYATKIVRSSETIEPILLPTREARLLAARPRTLALLVIGTAATQAGEVVEYTRSFIRSDRTRYRIDRMVHRPGWTRSFEPGGSTSQAAASAPPRGGAA